LAARKNRQGLKRKVAGIGDTESLSIKRDPNRCREAIPQAFLNVVAQFLWVPVLSAE
jgi:hypothetical protein